MRIGRKIIISIILALGAVGSTLAVSQGRPITITDGPVHVQITLSSASPNTRYYLARG
jgi:hypothetical protein